MPQGFPFWFTSLFNRNTKVVLDQLTIDASVKLPASASGLGVRARVLSNWILHDVEGVLDVSHWGY